MRKVNYKFPLLLISFLIGFAIINIQQSPIEKLSNPKLEKIRSTSSPKASIESKKGRREYFYRMLLDPQTKEIPRNIRQKELAFAKELQERAASLNKTSTTLSLDWKEAGPNDVGGRTRALAIDVNNSNIIIAGGVSGGIWKSTNKGSTWAMKSNTSQILSVTSIAQDNRSGQTNVWYYATGEFTGGSTSDRGSTHLFSGGGVYKSVDNGETWNLLSSTEDQNPTAWSSYFDYVSRILVSPVTGNVYTASHAFGVQMSSNGGTSFTQIYGALNDHQFIDIAITNNGDLIVAASSGWNQNPTNNPGVYLSSNDGQTWTNITPATLPTDHQRSVLATAPSNDNIVYLLTYTGGLISDKYEDIRFHKINLSNGTSEDRSANMPNFGYDFQDYVYTQSSYNLTLAVKPDDENFVIIGATSLFRSTDGFSTSLVNAKLDWIGGYHPTAFMYPGLHPDIHSFAFDPTNSNAMWWGHDGGLSYTSDIRNSNYATYFPWENKNNAYNVTQFYMVTIPDEAGDDRIMGGTQDNGSPFFRFDGTNTTASEDISSGDGSYAYWGNNFAYTSSQNGTVIRVDYDASGNPSQNNGWTNITPTGAENQLFINPYVVDPNNEDIMIYPAGNTLWRNNQLNSLPYYNQNSMSTGWTSLSNAAPNGYIITALTLTTNSPSSRLYYAAVDNSQTQGTPKLFRLDNAQTGTSAADISINGLQYGMYIHNIAVNPDNGDELIVIISNYNVMGIYYSIDGGASFTEVEGNLEGNQSSPGPSVRGASILPTSEGTLYLVATSTGVYSTSQINDSQTVWAPEGSGTVGNVICNYIASRKSDGRIVVGTHGRGAFMSTASTAGTAIASTNVQQLDLGSKPEETGYVTFQLSNTGDAALTYNVTATGVFPGLAAKNSGTIKVLNSPGPSMKESILARRKDIQAKDLKVGSRDIINKSSSDSDRLTLSDVIYLDDGDENADSFVGYGTGDDFYWLNEFSLTGYNFQLEGIDFYMRTETSTSNNIYIAVYDDQFTTLAEGNLTLSLAENGNWFNITLDNPIEIPESNTFYLLIGTNSSGIPFPAGTDYNATITGKRYYMDSNSNLIPLSGISGFENGAFLIRAVGTANVVSENQNPVAVANVNPLQAGVGEAINFDGSQSSDSDGSITEYLWNFGDGITSTQTSVNHSYSQAGNYTYSLLVTDNDGGTGQAAGQVTILEGVSRLSVDPSSGTLAPGENQVIRITLDAVGLPEGTYTGEVNIVTNGGNIILPLNMVINPAVSVKELKDVPTEFYLSQNYPNPFNPETVIEFSIPERAGVILKIYDIKGEEIKTLIQGNMNAGRYSVNFDASGLVSGIYIYRIRANRFVQTKKLILLK